MARVDIGLVVRSYRYEFSTIEKKIDNSFIEGVVVGFESWIRENDRAIVHWNKECCYGNTMKYTAPSSSIGDVWSISVQDIEVVSSQLVIHF